MEQSNAQYSACMEVLQNLNKLPINDLYPIDDIYRIRHMKADSQSTKKIVDRIDLTAERISAMIVIVVDALGGKPIEDPIPPFLLNAYMRIDGTLFNMNGNKALAIIYCIYAYIKNTHAQYVEQLQSCDPALIPYGISLMDVFVNHCSELFDDSRIVDYIKGRDNSVHIDYDNLINMFQKVGFVDKETIDTIATSAPIADLQALYQQSSQRQQYLKQQAIQKAKQQAEEARLKEEAERRHRKIDEELAQQQREDEQAERDRQQAEQRALERAQAPIRAQRQFEQDAYEATRY
jgi:nucleotide-binding universal stress UspA family protein